MAYSKYTRPPPLAYEDDIALQRAENEGMATRADIRACDSPSERRAAKAYLDASNLRSARHFALESALRARHTSLWRDPNGHG
jgi:hypothetical protein